MRIAVGFDDAGEPLIEVVKQHLQSYPGVELIDLSQPAGEAVEYYPDIAERVALSVAGDDVDRGVLVCGTGIGMAITACKVPGIRAAVCHDTYSAKRARKSNNAQILAMGARVIGPELAKSILDVWLASEFDERSGSAPKVQRIIEIDQKYTFDKAPPSRGDSGPADQPAAGSPGCGRQPTSRKE